MLVMRVKERPFPSRIAVASGPGSRSDSVIWSMQTKPVIWIELTNLWGENLTKTHFDVHNEAVNLQ